MASTASLWGARWLGHGALWGCLSQEVIARWGHGGLEASAEFFAGGAVNQPERLGLAALAWLMETKPDTADAGLFCGLSRAAHRDDSREEPGQEAGLMDCYSSCRAARHFGLAGSWLLSASGVAGGFKLIAHAQKSLAKGMPRAVCLAAYDDSRLAGGQWNAGSAAALGVQAGQCQESAPLGRIELGTYAGPLDSGSQTDFLEDLARRAKKQATGPIAAVVVNQPHDLKWQACLDAAARRIAPRARRYALPVDGAGQAGGLMLVMAATALATPRPESPRLVLAAGADGEAAALMVGAA